MDRGAGGGSDTPGLHSQQHRAGVVPNYMAATELAKARVRSQSAPWQQPSTPEHDRLSGGSSFGAGVASGHGGGERPPTQELEANRNGGARAPRPPVATRSSWEQE